MPNPLGLAGPCIWLAILVPGFDTQAVAAEFTAGGYVFSDELGGFRLLSASGSGTPEDPIIVVEELDQSPCHARHSRLTMEPQMLRTRMPAGPRETRDQPRCACGPASNIAGGNSRKPSTYEDGSRSINSPRSPDSPPIHFPATTASSSRRSHPLGTAVSIRAAAQFQSPSRPDPVRDSIWSRTRSFSRRTSPPNRNFAAHAY